MEVVKVKAHTDWWDVTFGRISHKVRLGNDMADEAAKAAQKVSERQSPTAAFNGQLTKAMQWLKWAMKYTVEWVNDVEVIEGKEDSEGRRRGGREETRRDEERRDEERREERRREERRGETRRGEERRGETRREEKRRGENLLH